MPNAASVNTWIWEETDVHDGRVPVFTDEERACWLALGLEAEIRTLTEDELVLFEALDRKAGYRRAHKIARTPARGRSS